MSQVIAAQEVTAVVNMAAAQTVAPTQQPSLFAKLVSEMTVDQRTDAHARITGNALAAARTDAELATMQANLAEHWHSDAIRQIAKLVNRGTTRVNGARVATSEKGLSYVTGYTTGEDGKRARVVGAYIPTAKLEERAREAEARLAKLDTLDLSF